MKIIKRESKIVVIVLLGIVIATVIMSCLYVNRENFINRIAGKSQTLQVQENKSTTGDISKWDLEKVNIVYDKDNVPVPVPKGYVASNVENGVTPIGQVIEEENRVNTGFVIYEMTAEEIANNVEVNITKDNFWEESQKRNQWVWVPVSDTSRIYERDSATGKAKANLWIFIEGKREKILNTNNREPDIMIDRDNEKYLPQNDLLGIPQSELLHELEKEFEATIESIEKYGGFYIGRYETGNVGSESSSSHNTPRKPVIQRMNYNIKRVTWYDAYNNIKNIQANGNIKSNMIWGCLWDETIQWLLDSGSKNYENIVDSVDWGNYSNSNFEYVKLDGKQSIKNAESSTSVPTGSCENNKANNIYDMAGNMEEWTLEGSYSGYRYIRDGDFTMSSTMYSVSYRIFNSSCNPFYNSYNIGVRAYFYIR